MMNPVVHFEMPYENRARLVKFYTAVFGWVMTELGEDMMDYVLAKTAVEDTNQPDAHKGTINGGSFPGNRIGRISILRL